MTRKEAIQMFEPYLGNDCYTLKFQTACSMAIAALREQDHFQEVTKMVGWISVNDRLPKNMANKVLVCCKNGYVGFGHYEKFRGNEVWYNLENDRPFTDWNLDDCETYEVTHWMPLPEPPEVEV